MLADGVLELQPFPAPAIAPPGTSGTATAEEPPQGMLRVHRLPIFHEKGGGGAMDGDDLAFSLSRRRGLAIRLYSLPPVDEDPEAERKGNEHAGHDHGGKKQTKVNIDF